MEQSRPLLQARTEYDLFKVDLRFPDFPRYFAITCGLPPSFAFLRLPSPSPGMRQVASHTTPSARKIHASCSCTIHAWRLRTDRKTLAHAVRSSRWKKYRRPYFRCGISFLIPPKKTSDTQETQPLHRSSRIPSPVPVRSPPSAAVIPPVSMEFVSHSVSIPQFVLPSS
jgi:hypothetical protein